MHCTLVVPDLLLPLVAGAEPYQGLPLTALETMLARGHTTLQAPLEPHAWLCAAFGIAKQQDWPIAPLLLSADGVDPTNHYWLLAEPVHLRVDRGRLLLSGGIGELSTDESRKLVSALNLHFAGQGLFFVSADPSRWYLRVDPTPNLVTTPLLNVINQDIDRHLPQGADAMHWHRVVNEMQMVLHAHEVNAAREAREAAAVNSVWLWGGGTARTPARPAFSVAWNDDALTRALALAAGVTQRGLPADAPSWLAQADADDDHLMVFDHLSNALHASDLTGWRTQLSMFESNWIAPLLRALRAGKITEMTLIAINRENTVKTILKRARLWRLWRHIRPLARYADAV